MVKPYNATALAIDDYIKSKFQESKQDGRSIYYNTEYYTNNNMNLLVKSIDQTLAIEYPK
jgi:hypothetical protein